MSDTPLVSVIIPNYNYGRSLGLCIEAVQRQDYPEFEIIVVDDASTDDSVAIARRLGVKVLSTGTNSGVASARNLGVAHARGEILLFVDSDIALSPGALTESVAQLAANPDLGAVCGMYEARPLIVDSLVEECRALQAYYWRISSEGTVSFLFTAICAMRRKVFDDVGPFNPRLRQTEEVDYGNRLSQRYDLLLTSSVRGSHDDDHQLRPLLRKVFTRGRLRIPLYMRRRKFAKGFETASRAWGTLAALAAVVSLPLPALVGPVGWLAPAGLLAATLLSDAGMYRFVAAERGGVFLARFTGFSVLFNVAVATGVVVGGAQWLLSPAFRTLYDPAPAPPAALPSRS